MFNQDDELLGDFEDFNNVDYIDDNEDSDLLSRFDEWDFDNPEYPEDFEF